MDYYGGNQAESRDSIEFTRTLQGLALMAVGTFLLWIPYLVYLGDLLNFIGIILIFLGRGAFQSSHGTYVAASIVLYFVTFIIVVAVAFSFVESTLGILLSSASQSVKAAQLTSAVTTLFVSTLVIALFTTMSFVLFSWKINDSTGHILLLIGYAASIAISIVGGLAAMSFVNTAFTNFINGASAQTVTAQLNSRKTLYSLYYVVPYAIFALTYYRTRSVISRPLSDATAI